MTEHTPRKHGNIAEVSIQEPYIGNAHFGMAKGRRPGDGPPTCCDKQRRPEAGATRRKRSRTRRRTHTPKATESDGEKEQHGRGSAQRTAATISGATRSGEVHIVMEKDAAGPAARARTGLDEHRHHEWESIQ